MTDKAKRPYFLWDYDLTDQQVREILRGDNETEKIWMMSRIIESARYQDVWNYMTYDELKSSFHELKLKAPIRRVWEHAFSIWE
ncbi:MAG: hypothetical protein Q8L37_03010 [Candidatus Gottesmanbacteria bacterium]|nr:hypothetical protein [Candidatus Gottesmanbacteria bacterium]